MYPFGYCKTCHKNFDLDKFITGFSKTGTAIVSQSCEGCRSLTREVVSCFDCGFDLFVDLLDRKNLADVYHLRDLDGAKVFKHTPSHHYVIDLEDYVVASCRPMEQIQQTLKAMRKAMREDPVI